MQDKVRGAAITIEQAWSKHQRRWRDNFYVYAVISRRSRGLSIGINLNPDKGCNFDCLYCQVDRRERVARQVDIEKLASELDAILQSESDGSLYEDAPFNMLKGSERGVRDIAFSGDGEPTLFSDFESAVRVAAQARRRFGLKAAKLILFTNASLLHKSEVSEALRVLDSNNGEIWAKLDAGTEEYFRAVNRSPVSLDDILANILEVCRARPIVIQSLWFRWHEVMPPAGEIRAYCEKLNRMISGNGRLKRLQLYTIARPAARAFVSPLSHEELQQIASIVRARVPVPVEVFPAT